MSMYGSDERTTITWDTPKGEARFEVRFDRNADNEISNIEGSFRSININGRRFCDFSHHDLRRIWNAKFEQAMATDPKFRDRVEARCERAD
jgi:hypothetical protein